MAKKAKTFKREKRMKELLRQKKQEEKRSKRQGKDRDLEDSGELAEGVAEGGEQPQESESAE